MRISSWCSVDGSECVWLLPVVEKKVVVVVVVVAGVVMVVGVVVCLAGNS